MALCAAAGCLFILEFKIMFANAGTKEPERWVGNAAGFNKGLLSSNYLRMGYEPFNLVEYCSFES